jgi:endonuclease G
VLLAGALAGLWLRSRAGAPVDPGPVASVPEPAPPAPASAAQPPAPKPTAPPPPAEEQPPPEPEPEPTPPAETASQPAAPPAPSPAELAGRYAFAGLPGLAGAAAEYRVLENIGYAVGWSETRKTPLWCAYHLKEGPPQELGKRPQQFFVDERTTAKVQHRDYSQRDYQQNPDAYDRGHMAPNYAMGAFFGREAQLESFKLTNVCPQRKGLNQQTWEAMEKTIAGEWVREFDEVWVTVGPVFGPSPERLNGVVQIPAAFYALILRREGDAPRVLALQMAQEVRGAQKLRPFVTTVRAVEEATGLDFFADLPDEAEAALETSAPDERWALDTVRVPSHGAGN